MEPVGIVKFVLAVFLAALGFALYSAVAYFLFSFVKGVYPDEDMFRWMLSYWQGVLFLVLFFQARKVLNDLD